MTCQRMDGSASRSQSMTGSFDDSDFASPRVRVMCSRPNVSAGVNGAIGKEILRERVADRTRKTVNRVWVGITSLTVLRFLNADRFPQFCFYLCRRSAYQRPLAWSNSRDNRERALDFWPQ